MIGVRTGRILFNMTDINQLSETASTRNPGVLQEVVGTGKIFFFISFLVWYATWTYNT